MSGEVEARLPASGQVTLDFRCKLCGKRVREQAHHPAEQFLSRMQHLKAKHDLAIHEFFNNFYTYVGE